MTPPLLSNLKLQLPWVLGFDGFLGLLHMEIIQERLRREYDLDLISTYPSVIYRVFMTSGEMIEIDNPLELPDVTLIDRIQEPTIIARIHAPNNSIGDLLALVTEKRVDCNDTETIDRDSGDDDLCFAIK